MTKICFISYEIHPATQGGCGVLLHHSARALLSQGHEVIFLLDMDEKYFQQFDQVDRLRLPNSHNCRAYLLKNLIGDRSISTADFISFYQYKSYQFYLGAQRVVELEHPEIIEFFEYCGVAYHSLSAKIAGLDFADVHLAVRLHNSLELIDRTQPDMIHAIDRYVMYGLEHQSMRLAETVLYPSATFLAEEYLNYYEPWFGNVAHSQPAFFDYPTPTGHAVNPDGILFLGRLFGFKGVDRFIDAAVLYLCDPLNPRRTFYLVGYDSNRPPTSQGSYRDYLLRKIPADLRSFFVFKGQISWKQLGELLPEVLFAVVPSFLESFCYAAHELYAAGIPLVVADIPAFKDSFHHGVNALVFDGTVGDLAEKIRLLSCDKELRQKITRPFPVLGAALGDFYDQRPIESWIHRDDPDALPELLVCVLGGEAGKLETTLKSLQESQMQGIRIVFMHPTPDRPDSAAGDHGASTWLLGGLYTPTEIDGSPLNPGDIRTLDALLILKAGDVLEPDYLPRALSVLGRQPQIAYVAGWLQTHTRRGVGSDTTPIDAASEIAPFIRPTPFNRALMRTEPAKLLIDLFDPRAGNLGELAYLWRLESDVSSGLVIPKAMVTHNDPLEAALDQPTLDYLILQDHNPARKARLARFSLSLERRPRTLRRFSFERNMGHPLLFDLERIQSRLATGALSKWMDRMPVVKKTLRRAVQFTFSSVSKLLMIGRKI